MLVNTPRAVNAYVGFTLGDGVAVDVDDPIVVGGWFEQIVAFCGDPLVSAGLGDLFLARFDASGTCLTSRRFGGSIDERAFSVGLTPSGSAVLTGHFEPTGHTFDGMQVTTNSAVRRKALNLFVGWATP